MSTYSDRELLDLFAHSDNPDYAFNLIVRKYQQQLYWHIRRMVISHDDTNDILQEVFIKAWRALASFRGDSELFTWLYRIATNETLSFLKKKRNKYFLPLVDVDKMLLETLRADVHYQSDQIQRKIQEAIIRLPEKQRLVFSLRYYDEMKYEDMAKVLDTSEGALKASYHHAVKKIEQYVKGD